MVKDACKCLYRRLVDSTSHLHNVRKFLIACATQKACLKHANTRHVTSKIDVPHCSLTALALLMLGSLDRTNIQYLIAQGCSNSTVVSQIQAKLAFHMPHPWLRPSRPCLPVPVPYEIGAYGSQLNYGLTVSICTHRCYGRAPVQYSAHL